MASQTWFSKWNYIKGKELPATGWQRVRKWVVNKFSSGVFTPDDDLKHVWKDAYVKDGGSRAAEANKRMQRGLVGNARYAVYKIELNRIARENELAHKNKPNAAYDVKEETRRLAVPQELINQLMNDPFFNPFLNEPDADVIRRWAADASLPNKPEYIQHAKLYRNTKDSELTAEQIADKKYMEKATIWNYYALNIQNFLADHAWAGLIGKPLPWYIEYDSGYQVYVRHCISEKKTPKPPATFWDMTFYGLRILYPPNLLDAVVGGICEGVARLICVGIDACSTYKASTAAVAVKSVATTLTGLTIVDGVCHLIGKLSTVSGWYDGFKAAWHAAKMGWNAVKKCCGCHSADAKPVRKMPKPDIQRKTQPDGVELQAIARPPLERAKSGLPALQRSLLKSPSSPPDAADDKKGMTGSPKANANVTQATSLTADQKKISIDAQVETAPFGSARKSTKDIRKAHRRMRSATLDWHQLKGPVKHLSAIKNSSSLSSDEEKDDAVELGALSQGGDGLINHHSSPSARATKRSNLYRTLKTSSGVVAAGLPGFNLDDGRITYVGERKRLSVHAGIHSPHGAAPNEHGFELKETKSSAQNGVASDENGVELVLPGNVVPTVTDTAELTQLGLEPAVLKR